MSISTTFSPATLKSNTTRSRRPPGAYWHVDDIERCLHALLEACAETQQEVKDVGGGKLIATVKDADGHVIGLIQPAYRTSAQPCTLKRPMRYRPTVKSLREARAL